nr:hypothetical protein [Tanacetum cinerariifolium]
MARLLFCDYHNMIAILEKGEHNTDFHPMVDFIEASPLRYALTVKPIVYVSHIRQFWSTARIKTMEEGTKILAIVDGIVRTISESSLRQNLKLQDKEGISSLPDTELFENLTLMGYNISPNQKFTFQKGQFSHQWKFLIHAIMQCLNPKSTGFNEFSSNIATALGEGSGTPTEPHHTPSQEAQPSSHTHISSPSIPTVTSVPTIPISTVIPSETTPVRQYTRRARIAQSFALLPIADEPASPMRDDSQGEACPTDSGFIVDQDRATIAKSSTLPHDSAPRVTSHAAKEGKDKKGVVGARSGDDAPIKGRSMDEGEAATERVSDDTEEMATVLTSMDAATVLANGVVDVPTGSGSIPTASTPAEGSIPIGSKEVLTTSPVFATTTMVTPVTRRKGKEVMVESETPKKKKVQEQIDAQADKELEEQLEKEDQRRAEQIARDAEIARIHAKEELQSMIDGLDSNNEIVAKYLEEYHQFSSELPLERRIELISDLVKDFRGVTFEEVEAKFNSFCKQMEDFIPMGSKEEAKKIKRKGINLEQESAKKQKSSDEITEEAKSPEEVPEEKVKEMMNLVPIEEVYVEALQVKHPIIDWKHLDREDLNQLWRLVKETLSTRPPTSDKEMELWVELSRLYEPDEEDQLQRQRNLYAYGEGLPSEEGSSTYDDLLQTLSEELLTDGK